MVNAHSSARVIGKRLVLLQKVDSTNSYLKQWVTRENPPEEGTVVVAEHQFAGRGQQGTKWLSEPGKNLTLSLLLCPTFLPLQEQFYLSKILCIALMESLHRYIDQGLKIKWPNDIYYHHQKLGGILVENRVSSNKITDAIVGIGINVNQVIFTANAANAVSLQTITGLVYDKMHLLEDLCATLERYYLRLKKENYVAIDRAYDFYLLGRNEERLFNIDGKITTGRILGVAPNGQLKIHIAGEKRQFNAKELAFIIR